MPKENRLKELDGSLSWKRLKNRDFSVVEANLNYIHITAARDLPPEFYVVTAVERSVTAPSSLILTKETYIVT